MNLGQLKEQFEQLDPNTKLEYGISEPFSWRGSYDEVCFEIVPCATVQQCLDNINKALSEMFYGHKGGEFHYNKDTWVNFESSSSSWSGGNYVQEMIDEMRQEPEYTDNERIAVSLMMQRVYQ